MDSFTSGSAGLHDVTTSIAGDWPSSTAESEQANANAAREYLRTLESVPAKLRDPISFQYSAIARSVLAAVGERVVNSLV